MLSLNVGSNQKRKNSLFYFLASWETSSEWHSFVEQYHKGVNFVQALEQFRSRAFGWNQFNFGNINSRKMRVLTHVGGLQRGLDTYSMPNL